jgi:pilus assembly protein CpaF
MSAKNTGTNGEAINLASKRAGGATFGRRAIAPVHPGSGSGDIATAERPKQVAGRQEDRDKILAFTTSGVTKYHHASDRTSSGIKEKVHSELMQQIDIDKSSMLPPVELRLQIVYLLDGIIQEQKLVLSEPEQRVLINEIIDDMLGFGPLEPLLRDEQITDILVNSPHQVYVERGGKLELTHVRFRDNDHVTTIGKRIVNAVGRRVDDSSPICDARLPDGSRVNVTMPPCVVKGTTISIRKFSRKKITLDVMAQQQNASEALAMVLKICGAIRLNILISGGTGSGKTTLLNAISQHIHHGERVITIEDAAELQLLQPHVVQMETRHANLEGQGEITMRDLVKNALRMRPDRIILGEVRGPEAFDLLQAMNTGHDGSMGTLHANSPREALTRLENMVGMAANTLSSKSLRTQITNAVNLIVQVSRMRDGVRRITQVTEVVGMEGDVIITHDLFNYVFHSEGSDGRLAGEFLSSGIRPGFASKAAYYGLEQSLLTHCISE